MIRKSWMLRSLAAAMLFALLGGACASGNTDQASDKIEAAAADANVDPDMDDVEEAVDVPTVDTQAATLTRDLTSLLDGHEYLAGIAIYTAVGAGGNLEDPTVQAAVTALDDNSVALSEAVGSVYGDAGAKQFLSLWRAHIGFFVDYT
ncbi:MAG TPA: hypothetical protein VNC78_07105, partial [Actinomycetota bacterium]|nr:hypothetical protein [Actinomycetota bacterium]